MRATYWYTGKDVTASLTNNTVEPKLKSEVTESTLKNMLSGGGSLGTMGDIIISAVLGSPSISATAEVLKAGKTIELEENHIMNHKKLTLTFRVSSLGDGDVVTVGHGSTSYGATYMEITNTHVTFYYYSTKAELRHSYEHGLTIKDYLNVVVDQEMYTATVSLSTAGGTYEKKGDRKSVV